MPEPTTVTAPAVVPPAGEPAATDEPASFADALTKALSGKTIVAGEIVPDPAAPADPAAAPVATLKEEKPAETPAVVPPVVEAKKEEVPAVVPPVEPVAPTLTEAELAATESKMDAKAGIAFKFVKNELKQEKARREELETKLREAEAKAGATDPAEVAALKEKLQKYEAKLSVVDIESTEPYQEKIAKPLQATVQGLAAIAKKYEIPESDLVAALRLPDANARTDKLSELSASFNRMDIARFDRYVETLSELEQTRETVLANAGETLKRLRESQETETRQSREQNATEWKSTTEKVFTKLQEESPLFVKRDDNPEWNGKLDKLQSFVREVQVEKLGMEEKAGLVYRAGAFPIAVELVGKVYEENQQLKEKLDKMRAVTPGAGAGTPVTPPSATSESADFEEAMKKSLAGVLP